MICGDRNWAEKEPIDQFIRSLPPGAIIIHGNCRGADRIADRAAREAGLRVEIFDAEWVRYGRAAGPIRNRRMLIEGGPDLVVAFHNDLSRSRGTKDLITQARKRAIEIIHIRSG